MTYKEYEEIIEKRMKAGRFKHSKNVAKEAVRLAKKYGADVQKAETAGILHDATKETPDSEQLELIERAGIVLTPLERSTRKLWHAISGAAFVQVAERYGVHTWGLLHVIRNA